MISYSLSILCRFYSSNPSRKFFFIPEDGPMGRAKFNIELAGKGEEREEKGEESRQDML